MPLFPGHSFLEAWRAFGKGSSQYVISVLTIVLSGTPMPIPLQYTEFTAYAALLSGAPPPYLQRSLVAHHPHLWKLREHHLYVSDDADAPDVPPITPGNPLRGYIPSGTQLSETSDGVSVKEPGRAEPVLYRSWASVRQVPEEQRGRLVDVFVTGEVRTRRCGSMGGVPRSPTHFTRFCSGRGIRRGASSTSWAASDRATDSSACRKNTCVASSPCAS